MNGCLLLKGIDLLYLKQLRSMGLPGWATYHSEDQKETKQNQKKKKKTKQNKTKQNKTKQNKNKRRTVKYYQPVSLIWSFRYVKLG